MLTHIPENIYPILPFASQIPLKCTASVKPNITKGKIVIKHSLTNFAFPSSGHQLTRGSPENCETIFNEYSASRDSKTPTHASGFARATQ